MSKQKKKQNQTYFRSFLSAQWRRHIPTDIVDTAATSSITTLDRSETIRTRHGSAARRRRRGEETEANGRLRQSNASPGAHHHHSTSALCCYCCLIDVE